MDSQQYTVIRNTAYALLLAAITTMLLLHLPAHATDSPSTAASATAPNWVIETANGRTISLNEELQHGRKVVIVFWSTWCSHCLELLPKLDTLSQITNENKATFIALNIWEDGNPLVYSKKHRLSLPLSLKAESIANQYQVKRSSEVVVIGQNNRILYRRKSHDTAEQVIGAIKEQLGLP